MTKPYLVCVITTYRVDDCKNRTEAHNMIEQVVEDFPGKVTVKQRAAILITPDED